jgi:hypothetical protein
LAVSSMFLGHESLPPTQRIRCRFKATESMPITARETTLP